MEIKLDIQLMWSLQRSSANAALLCSVFCLLQMPLLPVSWLNLSPFPFWIFPYVQDKTIIPIYFNIFDNLLLTRDQRYDNFMWKMKTEEYEHKLPLPQDTQLSFLHLEKLQGTAHHGVWRMNFSLGKPPFWPRCPPANAVHQLWKRYGLEARVTPETCPTPEGLSFPYILKSNTSLPTA